LAALIALSALVLAPAALANPNPDGKWEPRFELPYNFAIHGVMMPDGKLLTWSYPFGNTPFTGATGPGIGVASVWDPSKGYGADAFTEVNPPNGLNIWCAGQSLLSDGRVLITGGNAQYAQDLNGNGVQDPGEYYHGLNTVLIFDPWKFDKGQDPWTLLNEHMAHGRWYPDQVRVDAHRTLIFSGLTEHGDQDNNPDVEVFDDSKPVGQQISLIGTRGMLGLPPNGGAYPHTFLMPTGDLLLSGPNPQDSWVLPASGGFASLNGWVDQPDGAIRYAGTGVFDPFDLSRIFMIGGSPGGGGPNVDPLATIDDVTEGGLTPDPHPLNIGRAHLNTVVLPDGTMLGIGGGLGLDAGVGRMGQWEARDKNAETHSRRQIEIRDPVTGVWRLGPAAQEDRAYHSTALLLPDGRVFTGGDDQNGGSLDGTRDGVQSDQGEIYEPWYYGLPRPVLTSVPAGIDYGKSYSFDAAGVTKMVLMAPSAVTHANDMNARRVELTVTNGQLVGPVDQNIAPAGWYMLFGLNAQGVPSIATWVQVGKDIPVPAPPPPPPPPPDTTPAPPAPVLPVPPSVNPIVTPGKPFQPVLVDPEQYVPPAHYGTWDLRRTPLPEDCGNLDTPRNEFLTLRTKRGVNFYNVKEFGAGCRPAILLITSKPLKGYRSGRRSSRGFKCSVASARTPTVGRRVRTVTCKASGHRVIAWQVKL
jgi:hypothetical protein